MSCGFLSSFMPIYELFNDHNIPHSVALWFMNWPLRGILYPCVRVLCHCLMVPPYWKQACRSSALTIMTLQMYANVLKHHPCNIHIQKNSIRQQFCTGLRVTESWIEYRQLYRLDSFSFSAGLYMTFASRIRSRSIKATLEDASC